MQMNNWQDYGSFSADGREFHFKRLDTPRPWLNFVWGPRWVSEIDQRGRGRAWRRDDQGRVTTVLNDRRVIVKDRDSGSLRHIGWDAMRDQGGYDCAHGLGYTRLASVDAGLEATWEVTAAPEADVELWRVRVRNAGAHPRRLAVYPCAVLDLESNYYGTVENYLRTAAGDHTLFALVPYYERADQWRHGFFSANKAPQAFETRLQKLRGNVYTDWEQPAMIRAERLANGIGSCEPVVGALQFDVDLAPGQQWEVLLLAGACHDPQDVQAVRDRFFAEGAFDAVLGEWASRPAMDRVRVELPDAYLTGFFDTWLKHALLLNQAHSRLGFRGFRDSLQDAHGTCMHDPALTRRTLIDCARHQRRDGSCLRGWGPIDDHL